MPPLISAPQLGQKLYCGVLWMIFFLHTPHTSQNANSPSFTVHLPVLRSSMVGICLIVALIHAIVTVGSSPIGNAVSKSSASIIRLIGSPFLITPSTFTPSQVRNDGRDWFVLQAVIRQHRVSVPLTPFAITTHRFSFPHKVRVTASMQ